MATAQIGMLGAEPILVGRGAELQLLRDVLEKARAGHSHSLVVYGDAGIGKTALLGHALRAAEGFTVLRTAGVNAESELPFAGLSQLLQPIVTRLDSVPPHHAHALRAALTLDPPSTTDVLTVSVATLDLLGTAAGEQGLVAVVDDAHVLDTASLHVLMFAARRLGQEGVVVLFAARPGMPPALARSDLQQLLLRPLDDAEAHELLARARQRLAPTVAAALAATARGNPLALVELPQLLSEAQATGRDPLPDPLPSSEGIQRAFERQLEILQDAARQAVIVAAASNPETPEAVKGALDRAGIDHNALEQAEAAGLLALSDGPRFRHPLMRSAVYWSASPGERRDAHRTLADALPEEATRLARAWHRALAVVGPDEAVAAELEEGAADARARGAPGAAGRALERAARLSADAERRAWRLVAAAENLQLVGQFGEAFALLDQALTTSADTRLRANAYLARGRALAWVGSPLEAHALLTKAATELADGDPASRAVVTAESAFPLMMSAHPRRCLAVAKRAHAIAAAVGGPSVAVTSGVLAEALTLLGHARRAAAVLAAAEPVIEAADPLATIQYLQVKASFLAVLGEYDAARAILEQLISGGRHESAPGVLPYPLASLAYLDYRTGHWTRAYSEATEAVELARASEQMNFLGFALCSLAQVEAGLGHGGACRQHTADALAISQQLGAETLLIFIGAARLHAALSEGAVDDAIAAGEPVANLWHQRGYAEPALAQWHGDLIEAYVRAGHRQQAEELLRTLAARAEATQGAWARGVTARCRALLTDDVAFEDEYAEALREFARVPAPFERARTELSLGERRRRARRRVDARAPLRSSLQTFELLGARVWADRARTELRACGGRPREPVPAPTEGLTPHELHVALVVARGATNREAAAALFVSPKTIEFHLRNVYRKLGVRSRSQLAHTLAGIA